nr:aldose 1-epimerase family protein [Maliibacterium massiliense]
MEQTYALSCGKARATATTLGGELTSYVAANGVHYLWDGDPAVRATHAQMMFPIVGFAIEDTVRIAGVPYQIPKHGFARTTPFVLKDRQEDSITFTLRADEDTQRMYPFAFTLDTTHRIFADGFSTTYRIANNSSAPMPMCLGGHPGFHCPLFERDAFDDYELVFEMQESGVLAQAPTGYVEGYGVYAPLAGKDRFTLTHSAFDHDALIFSDLASRSVRMLRKKDGRGLQLDFPDFDILAVWQEAYKDAPYICIEPMSGHCACLDETGNFEDKPFVKIVPPGGVYEASYRMCVVD